MTVGIAALCEFSHGAKVVCATDGRLSLPQGVSADVNAPKMIFLGDWVFMFAGELSEADLILDHIRSVKFSHIDIKKVVRNAFHKRMAEWSGDRFLSQYDLDMAEFKKQGREMFGDKHFGDLSLMIEQDASNYKQQILVVGWGQSKHLPIFFGMSRDGLSSHAFDAVAAIGSGAEIALPTMFVIGQHREMTLEETIYSVAAAKFASERCDGVGQETTMYVSWKRDDSQPGRDAFVQPDQIAELRRMWEKYGKPAIPDKATLLLNKIATGLFGGKPREVGLKHVTMLHKAAKKLKHQKQPR